MSQHDMDVANGPGATVRTDINGALQALASNGVGALAPATTFPCQWWGDTTTSKLKRRNSANSAWIDMGPLDSLSYLLTSGGTLAGPVNDATPQTIASATTTDIGAATSNVVYISGTTTITGLGTIAAGARRTVRFTGSLLLTYNVTSLILPTAASITTAANDTAEFVSLGSGNWLCLRYDPASGKAPAFAYDRSNILGTVSQSGGIPTGSAMEYVTNANGEAWKFACGFMVATQTVTIGGGTVANGNIFRSLLVAIGNLPVTFAAVPKVYCNAFSVASGSGWGSLGLAGSASVWGSYYCFTATAVTGNIQFDMTAVGRWF
ncbi:hypothetical protein [Pseudomonas sp.]|uniref:hypothetical protein n=1 Tax=Pseudomonas sp. TaxID=306 RepID=UPI00326765D7